MSDTTHIDVENPYVVPYAGFGWQLPEPESRDLADYRGLLLAHIDESAAIARDEMAHGCDVRDYDAAWLNDCWNDACAKCPEVAEIVCGYEWYVGMLAQLVDAVVRGR